MDKLISKFSRAMTHLSFKQCGLILEDYRPTFDQVHDIFNSLPKDRTTLYDKRLIHSSSSQDYCMYMIKWKVLSISDVHTHPKNGCHMKVLYGKLGEEKHDETDKYFSILTKYQQTFTDSNTAHQIINLHMSQSYSLHVYSPVI